MMRGTFANVRRRNLLVPGVEGGMTRDFRSGDVVSVFDASASYRTEGVPLLILAGKDYGTGSSRDWAAKGPALLGVRAILAESFERIHRSNLIGMGILPLEYLPGDSAASLGLTGQEVFRVRGLEKISGPSRLEFVEVHADAKVFSARVRLDTARDVDYYKNGGIIKYVLRRLLTM